MSSSKELQRQLEVAKKRLREAEDQVLSERRRQAELAAAERELSTPRPTMFPRG